MTHDVLERGRSRRSPVALGGLAALLAVGGALWMLNPAVPIVGPEGGFRNLLLVSFDTTRADHIGCYGYTAGSTPIVDELARRGVLFETCISPTPITLPSHASLLTGLHPFSHGARNNGTHYLAADVPTLAERLSEQGFATGAVVSAFVLDSRFGLDQGFDRYDDDLSGGVGVTAFEGETAAEDSVARAIRWLDERRNERWFLWLHLFDPHADYRAPEPFAAQFPEAPYDGEIAYADAQLGALLGRLHDRGELGETLIVITADHGEALGEHGETTHGVFVYDATTRVPLILSHPSLEAGLRVPAVVSLIDVLPTVLELLGVPPIGDCDGRSLASVALGAETDLAPVPAYSETQFPYYNYGWADLRSLRDEEHRYIRAPRPELYLLGEDPGETRNQAARSPAIAARYESLLDALLPETERDTRASEPDELDPDVRAALAALGYSFSNDPGAEGAERPDPKDRIRALLAQQTAEGYLLAGRRAESEAAYRAVLATNPAAITARNALADLLAAGGKNAEALELHRGSLGLPGVTVRNFLIVAELERGLGLERWRRSLELARQFDPRAPMPWVREGDFVHMPADPEAALAAYRSALELDEHCALAWLGIAQVEMGRRNAPAALEAARHATDADPELSRAWFIQGTMNAAGGDDEQAVLCFLRARELAPEDVQTRMALTMLYAALGDELTALAELRSALALDGPAVEQAAARNTLLTRLLERVR